MNIWSGLIVCGLFFMFDYCNGQQYTTPYQVSIRMYDNDRSRSYVICNGALINESYVLTTAHCMHNHVIGTTIHRPLMPNMIFVAAGNFTNSLENVRQVSNILVHEQYNVNQWDNDIALIKLDQQFSLQNSSTIKWIQLDNMQNRQDNCFTSFINVTSRDYPFVIPQPNQITDSYFCNKQTNVTRRDSICGHYIFADSRMCETPAGQLELSADRGTALVCNNLLVGLLSTVLPANNTMVNSTISCNISQKTSAFYTKVLPNVQWINQKMSQYGPSRPVYNTGSSYPLPQQPNYPGSVNPQYPPQHPPHYPPQTNQGFPTEQPQYPTTTPPSNKRNGSQGQYSTMALVLAAIAATFSTVIVKTVF